MSQNIIDRSLIAVQSDIDQLFFDLHTLTVDIHNDDLAATVLDIRGKLNEPFLFVIVGEVKAGKSSFVNALLDTGRDICKVAPDPCTDIIQQITYGEKEEIIDVNPHLKKIKIPVPILEQISIVDTPGTNTIIDHHQEITERFVPHSDLIVFVFDSKNPYRQSAWDFFSYIADEWKKKVIFILQQKDLCKPDDLLVNINGVKKYAKEKGIADPRVFAVSALQEQEGQKEESGFAPLKEYIINNITGGNAFKLKMQSNVSTADKVLGKINDGMAVRTKQLNADLQFRQSITSDMNLQEQKSYQRVEKMVKSLLEDYDRITGRVRAEFIEGLGFYTLTKRSIGSVFSSKEKSVKEWLAVLTKKLDKDLRTNFQEKLEDGMTDISDSIKTMVKLVDDKMATSKTILDKNHEIFGDIADKRQDAIKAIQANYMQFIDNTENFIDEEITPKANYVPDVAAGGGIAIVGTILALSAQTAVFDITGGVIASLGILVAGATLVFRKRKVIAAFDEEIKKGRGQLEIVLEDQVKSYTHKIKERLDQQFDPFDIYIEQEQKSLTTLKGKTDTIASEILTVQEKLGEPSI